MALDMSSCHTPRTGGLQAVLLLAVKWKPTAIAVYIRLVTSSYALENFCWSSKICMSMGRNPSSIFFFCNLPLDYLCPEFGDGCPLLTPNLSGRELRPYLNSGPFLSGLDTAETPKFQNFCPDWDTAFSAIARGPPAPYCRPHLV